MNDYHLGAHSTSSSTTPRAKLPTARNWSSIQDSSLLHRLLGLSRGFQINRLSSQSMASSCPQPCSARKVLEDSKRPRWCSVSPVNKPLISPLTGISALVASWNTRSRYIFGVRSHVSNLAFLSQVQLRFCQRDYSRDQPDEFPPSVCVQVSLEMFYSSCPSWKNIYHNGNVEVKGAQYQLYVIIHKLNIIPT